MLYLIHGDQPEIARNKLVELKATAGKKEIRNIDGKRLDQTLLQQATESSSLFGSDVLVVIEGFISFSKKREKNFTVQLTKIIDASKNTDIILFEEKEVDKTTLGKFGNITHFFFKTPVVIFQFLDNLTLLALTQTLMLTPAEIVFSLLVRRVRQLIQCKDNVVPDGLQAWQATRLTNQAAHFTMDKLVAMHKALLDIDIATKTGASPFSLAQQLEQFIIHL